MDIFWAENHPFWWNLVKIQHTYSTSFIKIGWKTNKYILLIACYQMSLDTCEFGSRLKLIYAYIMCMSHSACSYTFHFDMIALQSKMSFLYLPFWHVNKDFKKMLILTHFFEFHTASSALFFNYVFIYHQSIPTWQTCIH